MSFDISKTFSGSAEMARPQKVNFAYPNTFYEAWGNGYKQRKWRIARWQYKKSYYVLLHSFYWEMAKWVSLKDEAEENITKCKYSSFTFSC